MTVDVVVPPNTTARVTLPGNGGEPIEVGAGTHRWSYPYSEARPVPRPLSLDSTLDELVDDPEACTAVLQTVPKFGDILGSAMEGRSDALLRDVIAHDPDAVALRATLTAVLAGLQREHMPG